MASVSTSSLKTGQIVYRARVRHTGKETLCKSFTSLEEAHRWIALMESMPQVSSDPTLAEAIEKYKREVLPGKRHRTIISQSQQLSYWRAEIGSLPLKNISSAIINTHRHSLESKHSGSTANRYLAILAHVYTVAIRDWEWISESPVKKVRRCNEPRGRTRFLSDDERQRLLKSCKASRNKALYPLIVLALSTGCRRNELLKLTWDDIDLSRALIFIRDSKNHQPRTLPITGSALTLLEEMYTPIKSTSEKVFKAPLTGKVYNLENAWQTALRRANIKEFRFHDLRHSCASYLAMNGATLVDIAAILGHRDLKQTMRYAHLSQHHTRGILERMTSML